MRLLRHPNSSGTSAYEVEVEIARRAAVLSLIYFVRGDVGQIRVPQKRTPTRTDGLWQSTCFEAFVRRAPSQAYQEFNFSPSLEWAAYRFDDYRRGMTAETTAAAPRIDVHTSESELRLSATLDLSGLAALPGTDDWRLALSAIIEEESGRKSYWALAHPPGKPDFHQPDGFALDLSPQV
jgi:hypothetical protein